MKILNSVPIDNFTYKNDSKNENKKHSFATNSFNFSSVSSNAIKSQALASINFTNKLDTTEEIVEKLSKEYGIEAHLTSYPQAKMLYDTVLEFVELNDKDMFKGLVVEEDELEEGNTYSTSSDYNTNEFVITYNNCYNLDDYKNLSKQNYDKLYFGSDNPKYDFYRSLGNFLCFKHNPYAYTHNSRKNNFSDTMRDMGLQIALYSLNSFSDYNANYIATRMSGKTCALEAENLYEECAGADLNFPKAYNNKFGSYTKKFDFKNLDEANKYLERYGIEADFFDLNIANLTCEAIEDFIELNNNKNMFSGLKIGSTIESDCLTVAQVACSYNYDTDEISSCVLEFNKTNDSKRFFKNVDKDYNLGQHPSNNPKTLIYHELAHWLDFHSRPADYIRTHHKYDTGQFYVNELGKKIFGRVSRYAKTSSIEFIAEYVSARMCGITYPETVNNEYEYLTNLNLVFPEK